MRKQRISQCFNYFSDPEHTDSKNNSQKYSKLSENKVNPGIKRHFIVFLDWFKVVFMLIDLQKIIFELISFNYGVVCNSSLFITFVGIHYLIIQQCNFLLRLL